MLLLTLKYMECVELVLIIKSVFSLVATVDHSTCVALRVGLATHVNVDNRVELLFGIPSYLNSYSCTLFISSCSHIATNNLP